MAFRIPPPLPSAQELSNFFSRPRTRPLKLLQMSDFEKLTPKQRRCPPPGCGRPKIPKTKYFTNDVARTHHRKEFRRLLDESSPEPGLAERLREENLADDFKLFPKGEGEEAHPTDDYDDAEYEKFNYEATNNGVTNHAVANTTLPDYGVAADDDETIVVASSAESEVDELEEIPDDIHKLVAKIKSLKTHNGFPGRYALRTCEALRDEFSRKTGVLKMARNGSQLRRWADVRDERLFSEDM